MVSVSRWLCSSLKICKQFKFKYMRRVIPKNVKVAAIKAYVADKKTLREVAQEFGINSESLRRWLGDKIRPRGSHMKGKPSNNPAIRKSTPAVAVVNVNPRKERTSKHSPTYNRANSRWSITEDEILRDAVLSKMTVKETTELLGRTPVSIYCRKNYLIDNGFISDPETKFVMPNGIKRVRKPLVAPVETSMGTPEVEVLVEDHMEEEERVTAKPVNIELSELAKIVKEYGVNVTVSMSGEGMEVKMSN